MKKWLDELKIALDKYFYEDEVKRILAYYEEMISERIVAGEVEEKILLQYNIPDIIKEMTLEVLVKRENETVKYVMRSLKQLLIILLSTPLLLPIGIFFLVVLILIASLSVANLAVVFTTLLIFIVFLVDLLTTGLSLTETMGLLGVSLLVVSMILLCSNWLFAFIYNLSKNMLTSFAKLAYSRGGRHENNN